MRGDFESARLVGERAAEATEHRDPEPLHLLAAAYAGLVDDPRAHSTAEAALGLARRLGYSALADSIEAWLPGYLPPDR